MSYLRTTIFSSSMLTAFGKGRTEIQQFTVEQLGFVSCILACQTAPRCPLYRGLLVPELPFLQAPVISGRNGSSRSSQGPGGKSGNRPGICSSIPEPFSHSPHPVLEQASEASRTGAGLWQLCFRHDPLHLPALTLVCGPGPDY